MSEPQGKREVVQAVLVGALVAGATALVEMAVRFLDDALLKERERRSKSDRRPWSKEKKRPPQ
jgi:hypothetical protein